MLNWKKYFLKFVFLISYFLLNCSGQKKQPNVVFFLVDDLGWKDTEIYGSNFYETPNINKLAENGVRFTQAYATCHVCSPTRASILTGKYPARLQLTDWLKGRSNIMPRSNYDYERLKTAKFHQQLPLTSVPTPGMKSAISKTNEPSKITQSNVSSKFEGMLNAIMVNKIPIIKKITCLDAK